MSKKELVQPGYKLTRARHAELKVMAELLDMSLAAYMRLCIRLGEQRLRVWLESPALEGDSEKNLLEG